MRQQQGLTLAVHGGASASLDDDIRLFHRARVVVGVHGAGLTNMLFCAPGAAVVELGVTEPCCGMYRHMARALGLRYAAHELGQSAFHLSHVHVDVASVARLVRQALEMDSRFDSDPASDAGAAAAAAAGA